MVSNEFHFSGPNLICSQKYPPYIDRICYNFKARRAWHETINLLSEYLTFSDCNFEKRIYSQQKQLKVNI